MTIPSFRDQAHTYYRDSDGWGVGHSIRKSSSSSVVAGEWYPPGRWCDNFGVVMLFSDASPYVEGVVFNALPVICEDRKTDQS